MNLIVPWAEAVFVLTDTQDPRFDDTSIAYTKPGCAITRSSNWPLTTAPLRTAGIAGPGTITTVVV